MTRPAIRQLFDFHSTLFQSDFSVFVVWISLLSTCRKALLDRRQFFATLQLFIESEYLVFWLALATFAGVKILARIAMTLEAPFHAEIASARGNLHRLHRTVTMVAIHSPVDVNTVIEIYEFRYFVHLVPLHGCVGLEAVPNGLEVRTIRPNLRVTSHANFGRRHARRGRLVHRSVTETTIDSQFQRMVLMAEWNRLVQRNIHFRVPRRASNDRTTNDKSERSGRSHEQANARESIRSRLENLCQLATFSHVLAGTASQDIPTRSTANITNIRAR